MNIRSGMPLAAMLVALSSTAIRADEGAKILILDHRTLDFQTDRLQRVEISGSLSEEGGKARLSYTLYLQGHHLNVFGDRVDDPNVLLKTTEHDVTLERLTRAEGTHPRWADPSASKDRVLYEIKGIDLGTNRRFLLMVSPKGPQRLIFLTAAVASGRPRWSLGVPSTAR